MMDSLSRSHVDTPHQQGGESAAELDQQAREDSQTLPGLVERVLQNVWKRFGLVAREAVPSPLPEGGGRLPILPPQVGCFD